MVMSIVEIFAGLSGILAPTICSVLFDNHGYTTPFYFSSGLQCFTLIVCLFSVKPVKISKTVISMKEVFRIIRIGSVFLCALMIVGSAANLGALDVGLSIYLMNFSNSTAEFEIDQRDIGLYFSASAMSYAGVGLFIGYLTDKRFSKLQSSPYQSRLKD